LAAGKETLNTDTQEPFDVAYLTEIAELDKLLFKLVKLLLVVRVVKHDDIVYVEEENPSVVRQEAWKALNRV
jgi:hypothetical protein